jgi:hypothetical protein
LGVFGIALQFSPNPAMQFIGSFVEDLLNDFKAVIKAKEVQYLHAFVVFVLQ